MKTTRKHISLPPKSINGYLIFPIVLMLMVAGGVKNAQGQVKVSVLPEAMVGQPYEAQLVVNGTQPFNWSLLNGSLAPGLSLTNDGALRGTPITSGPYRFKLRVSDANGITEDKWMSVEVKGNEPLLAPPGTETTFIPPAPDTAPAPLILAPKAPYVLPTSTSDEETITLTEMLPPPASAPAVWPDTAPNNVTALRAMIADSIGTSATNFANGDYLIVHFIRWKPLSAENKSEPDREIWALFEAKSSGANVTWNPIDDPKNAEIFSTRIFGHKRVAVLLMHLDTPTNWDVKYKVSITRKTPIPFQHAQELAGAILGGGPVQRAKVKNIWGARMMIVKYTASDIIVKVNAITGNAGRPIEQTKEFAKKFDNEGRYRWDITVGLPVQSVRELSFKSEGNQVVGQAKEKQSVYGFLNLYPWAVDLKSEGFYTRPHLVLGVPLASKPLHRPFVGLGTGVFKSPIKFNIFAGMVFLRQRVPRTLAEGDTATAADLDADLRTRWVRKFMFGINLPVSQIKDAIKK